MAVLLDTSVLIDVERGARSLPDEDEMAIAAITASELLHGVHRATARYRVLRETFVEQLLAEVPTVPFTLAVARVHARLWTELLAAGRLPGAHDLLVAATAIAIDWPLATLNRRHFDGVPGLRTYRASADRR